MLAPGAHDAIDHAVADHVDENLFQARADQRAGQAQDDAALLVAEHAVVNVGRPGQVAGAVGHVPHGLDQRHDVVLGDVDVFDRLRQQFFLARHGEILC